MLRSLGLLTFALALSACAQATQIVLVVDSDLDVPDELGRIDIDVTNSMATPTRTSIDLTSGSAPALPLTLGITSRRSDADVRIEVRGYLSSGEILVRDVTTRLTPGSSRMLRVLLARRCLTATCSANETCDETGCRSVDVDPEELPGWAGAAPSLDGPACTEAEETCNLTDDDCDGATDEGITLLTDAANCGRCGHACDSGGCTGGYCAGERPTLVVAGGAHTCVRRESGAVACFGWNAEGQLGSSALDRVPIPLDVPALEGIAALGAGGAFGCVIDGRGQVQCVGDGDDGGLGRGDVVDARTYGPVTSANAYTALAVSTRHACATEMDGSVVCWGESSAGEAGPTPGVLVPTAIAGAGGASALGVGNNHSCAVVDGSVLCWGGNGAGQLGADPTMVPSSVTPQLVPGLDMVEAVALGRNFTCALRMGAVLCWGDNSLGQLGSTMATSSFVPLPVDGITDATAITAAAGGLHACALRTGGGVSCWGANLSGQLGDGTTDSNATPVEVMNVSGAISVAAGGLSGDGQGHTCVVLGTGEVRCCGDGTLGQTGDPTFGAEHTTMVAVPGLP